MIPVTLLIKLCNYSLCLQCLYAYRAEIHESEQLAGDHEEWEKATSAESAGVNFPTRSMVRLSISSGA